MVQPRWLIKFISLPSFNSQYEPPENQEIKSTRHVSGLISIPSFGLNLPVQIYEYSLHVEWIVWGIDFVGYNCWWTKIHKVRSPEISFISEIIAIYT